MGQRNLCCDKMFFIVCYVKIELAGHFLEWAKYFQIVYISLKINKFWIVAKK